MITGFNTDIEFQGITYHVQTEDKGVDTPLILSLVYDRGTILASKRSPYDDLLSETFDEKLLIDRLQKQHKLMCAAVRAGRIDDLKRMTMKDSASRQSQKGLIAKKEITVVEKEVIKFEPARVTPPKPEKIAPPQIFKENAQFPKPQNEITLDLPQLELPQRSVPQKISQKVEARPQPIDVNIPKPTDEMVWDIPINIVEEDFIEDIQIYEEEIILPAEAVEIISDSSKNEQFVDYTLKIQLLNEIIFKGGERKTISILVYRGSQEMGLSGAQVIVKVIGTSFRPLIFTQKPTATVWRPFICNCPISNRDGRRSYSER